MSEQIFSPVVGIGIMIGLGLIMLVIALWVKKVVPNTRAFIIAGRKLGSGFGTGSMIAVWTWSMAVMMSSAQSYTWGISGLLWFVIPNGLAVALVVPFALRLRKYMPNGYTLVQFIRERFNNKLATALILGFMVLALFAEVIINLLGTVIIGETIFGLNPFVVMFLTLLIVMIYAYFGGLWTSAITGTINTLLISVPAAIVILFVLYKAGGPVEIFATVMEKDPAYLNPFRWATAAGFGISLALGLFTSTLADQTFWQKVWALKPESVSKVFLWSGAWFYPIPLTLGLLGFVGIALGITPDLLGSAGTGAIGPYVVAHIGIPVIVVGLYVLLVLNACYSSIDGAFSALASIVAVDVVGRMLPNVSEKNLFRYTKISIPIAGIIAGSIVAMGPDYVNIVMLIFFLKSAILLPVILSMVWSRLSTSGFVVSIVVSLAGGLYVRQTSTELWGIVTMMVLSVVLAYGISVIQKSRAFNFYQLSEAKDSFN